MDREKRALERDEEEREFLERSSWRGTEVGTRLEVRNSEASNSPDELLLKSLLVFGAVRSTGTDCVRLSNRVEPRTATRRGSGILRRVSSSQILSGTKVRP